MRVGSLCSGYGGLDLAVHEVLGGELTWVADNDPAAAAILAHRFPSVPNYGDITVADWTAVESVDAMCMGFPCTDVSCAGARAGLRAGTRSGVWTHCARAISELRPSLVVIENVRGLLSAGADSDVESCAWCMGEAGNEHPLRASGAVLGDLADLGYDTRWAVVSAAEAGAPHRRERVFIVAWPAADACGGELQRRGIPRILGSAPAGEPREGDQRERAGDPAGRCGSTAAEPAGVRLPLRQPEHLTGGGRAATAPDGRGAAEYDGITHQGLAIAEDADRAASGERRQSAPGQAAGGRARADAGGPGGTPAIADACGEGLEIRPVEHHGPQRHAAERGRGDAPADADADDYAARAGREPGGTERRGAEPAQCRGTAADALGVGRNEGRSEPAGVVGRPDAAERGDEPCPSCGCADTRWVQFHDAGGFCAGPCGGNCTDPERGRPGGPWNNFEDDADPAEVRAYALAHSADIRHGDAGETGERGIPAAAVPGAIADPDSDGLTRSPERHGEPKRGQAGHEQRRVDPLRRVLDWGNYAPAIHRWEAVLGRPAPRPTEPGRTGERLSPRFVEFLMGLPEGWVTDVPGLSRNAQLKALGNGVVPAQAAMALRMLLARAGIPSRADGEAA